MPRYDHDTVAAIHEALDDEYRARAVYGAIIERHGPVRPFVNIIASEDRHASALESLLRSAGLPVPADRWAGRAEAPATLRDAYALGVQAEIDNRAMYDRLNRMTSEPEVLRVFGNLSAASRDNHLPAFQRHLDRIDGRLSGSGAGQTSFGAVAGPDRRDSGWRGGAKATHGPGGSNGGQHRCHGHRGGRA